MTLGGCAVVGDVYTQRNYDGTFGALFDFFYSSACRKSKRFRCSKEDVVVKFGSVGKDGSSLFFHHSKGFF